jgi:hypothetical protein
MTGPACTTPPPRTDRYRARRRPGTCPGRMYETHATGRSAGFETLDYERSKSRTHFPTPRRMKFRGENHHKITGVAPTGFEPCLVTVTFSSADPCFRPSTPQKPDATKHAGQSSVKHFSAGRWFKSGGLDLNQRPLDFSGSRGAPPPEGITGGYSGCLML